MRSTGPTNTSRSLRTSLGLAQALADDHAFGVDQKLRIGTISQSVLEPIVHGVHYPRNRCAKLLLRLPGVREPLFLSERLHIVFQFGMRSAL